MKRTVNLISILSLLVIGAFAASPIVTSKAVVWKWSLNPADLGGMTTNQYYTNIVFRLYRTTDCTTPTNQWPEVTNWLASSFPSTDGVNWTNYVATDGNTAFYLMTVGASSGSTAPFSNPAVWVATPPPGVIQRVGP